MSFRSIEQEVVMSQEVIAVDSLWSAQSFKDVDRVLLYKYSISTVVAAIRPTHVEEMSM